MHIVYGGVRSENEHISSKYKSVRVERFVFQSPPQNHMLTVGRHAKKRHAMRI